MVRIPKVHSQFGKPVSCRPALVPIYVRKTKTLQPAIRWRYLKHCPAVVACSDQGRVRSPRGRHLWHQITRRRMPNPTRNYRRMIKGLNIRIDHSLASLMRPLWAGGEVPAYYKCITAILSAIQVLSMML